MKKITIVSIIICAIAAACTKSLLAKLENGYDYKGKGYAVWMFRSAAQDGPSREIIEDIGDGCRLITPLPSGLHVDNLQDCTVSAAFTPNDFRWMGGTLDMTVYNRDLYDAVDIATMHVGDTIIYDSRPMVISTIDKGNYGIDINKGPDNGGCRLVGYGGGTYVAKLCGERTTYTELGKAHLALDQDFIIIDCGTGPNATSDTIRSAQKLYIEKMNERRLQFTQFDTRVTIENGLITEISRIWILWE